jgi:hypothetical protein
MSKETTRNSSTTEKPLCRSPRRLVDWLNPDGQKKVHWLVDKVYQPKCERHGKKSRRTVAAAASMGRVSKHSSRD